MTESLALRNRLLRALGAGTLLAVTLPQCSSDSSDTPTPRSCYHPTEVACFPLAVLNVQHAVDSGLEAGAAGSGASAGAAAVFVDGPLDCPARDPTPQLIGFVLITPANQAEYAAPAEPGQCCYGSTSPLCLGGRPYLVDGRSRVAETTQRGDWKTSAFARVPREPALSEALARAWLSDAHAEHASVASFARLTLDLLAHGAPPDLIVASQLASLDEIEHARACFALASSYAETPFGPGKFELGRLEGARDLTELTLRTIEEGCVGETIAALVVAEQARVARDPELRRVLARIADDEARHAELAWRVVSWAIESGGPELLAAARLAFEGAGSSPQHSAGCHLTNPEWLAHGRLGAAEQQRIIRDAHDLVISPCALALS